MGQTKPDPAPDTPAQADIVIFGDELESVLTAISAAMLGVSVVLIRQSTGMLGGLSTRGGLSYMDITPEFIPPLMQQFFKRIGFKRVALDAQTAHQNLSALLEEHQIPVISGVTGQFILNADKQPIAIALSDGHNRNQTMSARHWIDTTPDADYARQLGIPYITGLGDLFGKAHNFLGISPVFRITGVSPEALIDFEAQLRATPELPLILEKALPYHEASYRQELISRPCFMAEDPSQRDYLDILNPVIGILFHLWRYGQKPDEAGSYATAEIAIDGANIALLPDGSLGFNGLVKKSSPDSLKPLLAWSHGEPCPNDLQEAMCQFERYLTEAGGLTQAKIIPPQELYVRQTLTLLAKANMTAEAMMAGGVSSDKAIGTFSYWLDVRGLVLSQFYPGEKLPKPVFNVGLDAALPLVPSLDNVAFVSRSAGYSPLGQGAGRIIQHNCMLGEAVGIAMALACLNDGSIHDIADTQTSVIREILSQRQSSPIQISGHPVLTDTERRQSSLLRADQDIVSRLRNTVTLELLGVL